MCGVVGAFDLRGTRNFPPERLARMAAAVRHRGPDEAGAFHASGVAMATQRLVVYGAEHGRQPLGHGRVVVSFNGELFNHAELRAFLRGRGHQLPDRGDTVLWPGLFAELGADALTRVEGQFAVALWERPARRLTLARDRAGICPLHYAEVDGWLLWSSEVKGLLASGLVQARLDPAGLDHILSLFAASPSRTCFAGVRSLPPGHVLTAQDGRITFKAYASLDFPDAGKERRADPATLIDEAQHLLEDAVARRLDADGPVASYLSGGLDSTLMLGLASRRAKAPLTAFTVGLDGAGDDEHAPAAETARLLGATHRVLRLEPRDISAALPRAVEAAESPILDMANPCVLRIAELAAQHGFKAVLSGEGADEAMAGYAWHKLGRLPRPVASALSRLLGRLAAPGTPSPGLHAALPGLRAVQLVLYEPLSRAKHLVYAPELARFAESHRPLGDHALPLERMRRWHPLNQGLYLDYRVMLAGHLLVGKGDRVAMHSALEHRFPFLDERFVAFASELAPHYKLRGLREKWLLREVARRVLPRAIASRPKGMFRAHSLCELTPLPAFVDQLLSPAALRTTGYFDADAVARERRLQRTLSPRAPRRYAADAIFSGVVTTQLFHHLFLGDALCELPRWRAPEPKAPLLTQSTGP